MAGRNYQGAWIIHMDTRWKKAFKILAIQQDLPVYEVIDEALSEYAKRHGLTAENAD